MRTAQAIVAVLASAMAVQGAVINARQAFELPGYSGMIPLANSTIKECVQGYPANEIDSCDSIARFWRISTAKFLTYNPVLDADCGNIVIGQQYCIQVSVEPTTLRVPKPAKGKKAPGPTFGTTIVCDQWQKVFPEDTCADTSKIWRVSLADLVKWNPDVGEGCKNLKVNSYLCVRIPTST